MVSPSWVLFLGMSCTVPLEGGKFAAVNSLMEDTESLTQKGRNKGTSDVNQGARRFKQCYTCKWKLPPTASKGRVRAEQPTLSMIWGKQSNNDRGKPSYVVTVLT
ncbi:hypothetical protein F5146DRAFT_1166483 [Armillaria mellea]|nr:hypothetical protein F5146DRAFT_1166483 [Armillaria mellea]